MMQARNTLWTRRDTARAGETASGAARSAGTARARTPARLATPIVGIGRNKVGLHCAKRSGIK
jgi:hypothetical protein